MSLRREGEREREGGRWERTEVGGRQVSARGRTGDRHEHRLCLRLSPHVHQEERDGKGQRSLLTGDFHGRRVVYRGTSDRRWRVRGSSGTGALPRAKLGRPRYKRKSQLLGGKLLVGEGTGTARAGSGTGGQGENL